MIAIKNILTAFYTENKFIVKNADVYIKDGLIASIDNKPENFEGAKIIDGKNRLLFPGLINAHTHAYMSLFKNSADDIPFSDWLFKKIMPMEDKLTSEDAYWGSMLGIIEMIKTGTTCFADMQMFIHQTTKAVAESGIRACITRGLTGNGTDEDGIRRINEAKEEYFAWRDNSRITFMLAPHAPYTCDKEYLKIVMNEASSLNLGLNIHVSESEYEVSEMQKLCGKTPVEYLESIGLLDFPVLAAHCVHLTDNDIEILARHNVNVVSNPVSNLKLANGIAPVDKLLKNGVNVCLGTDGSASNNSLNIFKELSFVTLLLKGINRDAEVISANTGLELATVNGAKALGLDKEIGKIEPGMKADLIILDLDRPQYYPRNNIISALSYSTQGSEVETVIIDGKIIMENSEIKTIDCEKVYYMASKIC